MKIFIPSVLGMLLTLSFLSMAVAGQKEYTEKTASTEGLPILCQSDYWNCYVGCPKPDNCKKCLPDKNCLLLCEKKYCAKDKKDKKGKKAVSIPSSSSFQSKATRPEDSRPKATLRHDGLLTGPGQIYFEAFNRDAGEHPLEIYGIVYGRKESGIEILKQTRSFHVLPSKSTRFSLTVTPKEYSYWSKTFSPLTIAITFPDEKTGKGWKYDNLLGDKDIKRARTGEFQIKGAFIYKDPK